MTQVIGTEVVAEDVVDTDMEVAMEGMMDIVDADKVTGVNVIKNNYSNLVKCCTSVQHLRLN